MGICYKYAFAGRLSYLSHVVTAPHHDRQAKPNTRRCIPVHYPPVSPTSILLTKQLLALEPVTASKSAFAAKPNWKGVCTR